MADRRMGASTALAVTGFCLLWGANSTAIKVSLEGAPPLGAAGIRFILASGCVYAVARLRRIPLRPGESRWRPLGLLATIFTIQQGLMNIGINLTTASRAALFIYAQPLFVAILAHWFVPDERLSPPKVLGVLLCLAGLAVALADRVASGPDWSLIGDLLVLAGGISWAVQTVYLKHLVRHTPADLLILSQMVVAGPIFLLLSVLVEGKPIHTLTPTITAAFLYQGVLVAGLTFVAWTALIQIYPVSQLTSFLFLTPIFGVLTGALVLGDPLTRSLLAGLALVATGIYLVNLPRERAGRPS